MENDRRPWYLLVNGLTISRAFLSLGIICSASQGDFTSAAVLSGIALATDQEGRIARRMSVTSGIGKLRDVLADECFFTAFFSAAMLWSISQLPEIGKEVADNFPSIASLATNEIPWITGLLLTASTISLIVPWFVSNISWNRKMLDDYRKASK